MRPAGTQTDRPWRMENTVMTKKKFLIGLGGMVLAGASALGLASATSVRADCPGKITCPLTGEVICRDECPNVDPDRPDCPGRIECPLTGDLICVDQCPVGTEDASAEAAVPSCCQSKE